MTDLQKSKIRNPKSKIELWLNQSIVIFNFWSSTKVRAQFGQLVVSGGGCLSNARRLAGQSRARRSFGRKTSKSKFRAMCSTLPERGAIDLCAAGVSYHQMEITYSRFEKTLQFPASIEGASIEHIFDNGLLIIRPLEREEKANSFRLKMRILAELTRNNYGRKH